MAESGVMNPPPHDEWCHTHRKGYLPFSYKWTIHNFSLRREKPGEKLKSSIFSAGHNEQCVELHLSIYPRGNRDGDENYLSVFLNVVSCNGLKIRTDCQISILNAEQKEVLTINLRCIIKRGSGRGWSPFINRTVLMTLLPDDNLTLLCKGSIVLEDIINTSGKMRNTVKFVVPDCAALDELGHLLESCKFTDVAVSAGDEEIQAHKAILAARSSVFKTIFNSEVEEAAKNRVEISDIEPKVLREMIRFIYTGEAPNLEKMAAALITAADKYDLGRLKVMCAEALFKSLSSDNAAHTLLLADQHNEKQLKVRTIDFINTNLKHVIDTPSFKIMANSHPHLAEKILRRTVAGQGDSECESDELSDEENESK